MLLFNLISEQDKGLACLSKSRSLRKEIVFCFYIHCDCDYPILDLTQCPAILTFSRFKFKGANSAGIASIIDPGRMSHLHEKLASNT